jgi:hypothetical protein
LFSVQSSLVPCFLLCLFAFLLAAIVSIIILSMFGVDKLVGSAAFGATLTVIVMFGISVTSFAYFFSFAFSNPSTGQSIRIRDLRWLLAPIDRLTIERC